MQRLIVSLHFIDVRRQVLHNNDNDIDDDRNTRSVGERYDDVVIRHNALLSHSDDGSHSA